MLPARSTIHPLPLPLSPWVLLSGVSCTSEQTQQVEQVSRARRGLHQLRACGSSQFPVGFGSKPVCPGRLSLEGGLPGEEWFKKKASGTAGDANCAVQLAG